MTYRWGPHGWRFLHYVTIGFPEQPSEVEKMNVYTFFQSVADVLPCAECRGHFRELLIDSPPRVQSGRELREWLFQAHNTVNERLGKPIFTRLQFYNEYGVSV